jgi:transcriptional regulator with XRE-family HTH domain
MLLRKDRRMLLLKMLKDARLERGLRQLDVALALGRPQSYVAKVESGERKVDCIDVIDFCNVVKLDPVKLVKRLK